MEKQSFTKLLLPHTEQAIWERGEQYAYSGKVVVLRITDKSIDANVLGTEVYRVTLKFVGSGISKNCTCPYPYEVCKHLVATAIIWDRNHGIKIPTAKEIKMYTIKPTPVRQRDFNKMFADPLSVDLDLLRIITDYSALSSKEHSRLPKSPRIESNEKVPLQFKEVKQALKEMKKWTRRKLYHSYFCAGEMSAAFCELLDVIKKREPTSNPNEMILIMAHCVDWYYRKFNQIVDGSDGVWLFPKVRIGKIVSILKEKYPSNAFWSNFREMVKKAGARWSELELDDNIIADWHKDRL